MGKPGASPQKRGQLEVRLDASYIVSALAFIPIIAVISQRAQDGHGERVGLDVFVPQFQGIDSDSVGLFDWLRLGVDWMNREESERIR